MKVLHGSREPYIEGARFMSTFLHAITSSMKKNINEKPLSAAIKAAICAEMDEVDYFVSAALEEAKKEAERIYPDIEIETAPKPYRGEA